jgi:hypothetical protein
LATIHVGCRRPTFGEGGRAWDHIDLIVEKAATEASEMSFRRDVMRKTTPTPTLRSQAGFYERATVAEREIGPALEVVDPARSPARASSCSTTSSRAA